MKFKIHKEQESNDEIEFKLEIGAASGDVNILCRKRDQGFNIIAYFSKADNLLRLFPSSEPEEFCGLQIEKHSEGYLKSLYKLKVR